MILTRSGCLSSIDPALWMEVNAGPADDASTRPDANRLDDFWAVVSPCLSRRFRLSPFPVQATRSMFWKQGSLFSRIGLALVAGVVLLVTVLAGGPAGANSPRPAVQYDCSGHHIVRTRGPLVRTAHGIIGRRHWTLEVDSARHGIRRVLAGRLMLGGRAYGFCATRPPPVHARSFRGDSSGLLDVELVNAGPHGIVYGLAARLYRPPIVIEATTAHGTPRKPVRAHNYPARTRPISQATLFLRALPASACAYRDLAVSAHEHPTRSGTGTGVDVFYSFTRSCRPGQLRHSS